MDEAPNTPSGSTKRKAKSEGRRASMVRLNALGLRGPGGRPPTHGIRALEMMLARGQEPEGLAGQVLSEHETRFASDFGGAPSAKQQGGCRRLSELELKAALIRNRLITPTGALRRLPWRQEKEIIAMGIALAEAYAKICSALGWQRRERELPDVFEYLKRGGNGANIEAERPTGAQEPSE